MSVDALVKPDPWTVIVVSFDPIATTCGSTDANTGAAASTFKVTSIEAAVAPDGTRLTEA